MGKNEPYYENEDDYGLVPQCTWNELCKSEKSMLKKPTMAILEVKHMPTGKISLDISEKIDNGVGFFLIQYAKQLAPQLGMNTNEIIVEMSKGDEENLIQVFNNHFDEVVNLYR